eukprot:COSAG02_NODE_3743_length_6299_cov_27.086452_5_plen_449_part_00
MRLPRRAARLLALVAVAWVCVRLLPGTFRADNALPAGTAALGPLQAASSNLKLPVVSTEPMAVPIGMAMRYCAYSNVPDRYGSDLFKQAKSNPEIMKMFANGQCRGGAYGGEYVVDAFQRHGFAPVRQSSIQQDNWTVLWTQNSQSIYLGMERPDITADLRTGRRIHNHCTLILYAGDKCALARHMEKVRQLPAIVARGSAGASGLLRSYLMHEEEGRHRFAALATMDRSKHPEAGYTHMMKPCVASGAAGQLFWPPGTTLDELPNNGRTQAVLQEYVASPLLYEPGGVKFHLRLYLLVTSYAPMRLSLARKGLMLRATQKYSYTNDHGVRAAAFDPKMHLTNTKINAAVPLSLDDLWTYISNSEASRRGAGTPETVWRRIKDLSAKLLCTHELSTLKSHYHPCTGDAALSCFDIFGLDVLLDQNLIPWVMEINEGDCRALPYFQILF